MHKINKHSIKSIFIFLLIFSIGVGFGYAYFTKNNPPSTKVQQEKNTPKAFLGEVYDKVKENYWDNLSDAQLIDLFRMGAEKALGAPLTANITGKDGLMKVLEESMKGMDDEKKVQFVANVSQNALASLNPQGRSGLFTQKQEEQLKNTVENINPEKDLYKDLGLGKNASEGAVEKAYQQQSEKLKKDTSAEAQEKLKQLTYAKDVLTQDETKKRYDEKGVEPAIFAEILGSDILYLKFSKFTPTSLEEFQQALVLFQDKDLDALIFDLRGNVGGAIDTTAYFLGFFIGKNQYAFDFYHKGEYLPFKTQTDKLPIIKKFKQIVVLTDNATQSSAEMLASTLKKYNIGIVLGIPTKGWGTVEKVFQLDNQISEKEKYSLFLVHSITLRDDNQPIEGRGVEPNININDKDWQTQLFSHFRNQQLIEAIKDVL